MKQQNVKATAEAFYTAFGEKTIEAMAQYLHPDVQLTTPLIKRQGKASYLEAAKGFASAFDTLTIRTAMAEGDEAVVVYDVDFPAPIGKVRTAALITFQDRLISRIELFFDATLFH